MSYRWSYSHWSLNLWIVVLWSTQQEVVVHLTRRAETNLGDDLRRKVFLISPLWWSQARTGIINHLRVFWTTNPQYSQQSGVDGCAKQQIHPLDVLSTAVSRDGTDWEWVFSWIRQKIDYFLLLFIVNKSINFGDLISRCSSLTSMAKKSIVKPIQNKNLESELPTEIRIILTELLIPDLSLRRLQLVVVSNFHWNDNKSHTPPTAVCTELAIKSSLHIE